jgi:putative PIN family toxin of toxin-antitoxin system
MRIVLDTNIMVRAAGRADGPAQAVFLYSLDDKHSLIMSEYSLRELHRVLLYPRIQRTTGWSLQQAEEHVREVSRKAEIIELPGLIPAAVPHDPADDPIVATAVAGQADVLCTLDRHLRRREVEAYCAQFGIRILTDVELLTELRQ